MNEALQQQLLALNSRFYETVAEPFDTTRMAPSAGKSELVRRLPLEEITSPRLADIGCGNGRLAWLLEERGVPLRYVGVDANAHLLAMAQTHTASLRHVRASFVQADLAQPEWPALLPGPEQNEQDEQNRHGHKEGFDIVTCLATLQHLPGYDLRLRVVRQLAALVRPGGLVAISTWQFLTSVRFAAKQVAWAEVGIDGAEVEPGDALLPWKQGSYAVRYLHQIDLDEVMALSHAAGLRVDATYFADGKEGNLNLYAILRRPT